MQWGLRLGLLGASTLLGAASVLHARDAALRSSVFSVQGRRPYQEDEVLVEPDLGGGSLYAIFDGHGGGGTSFVARLSFARHFARHLGAMPPLDMAQVWARTYRDTEEAYRAFPWAEHSAKRALPNKADEGREGSTAVAAFVRDGIISVANAGDSRCVLCHRDGGATALSNDHTPLVDEEASRLAALGFIVKRERIYKTRNGQVVGGGLNLSRALGDFFYEGGGVHSRSSG